MDNFEAKQMRSIARLVHNISENTIHFVSTRGALERIEWMRITFKPNEKKWVPHAFFDVVPDVEGSTGELRVYFGPDAEAIMPCPWAVRF